MNAKMHTRVNYKMNMQSAQRGWKPYKYGMSFWNRFAETFLRTVSCATLGLARTMLCKKYVSKVWSWYHLVGHQSVGPQSVGHQSVGRQWAASQWASSRWDASQWATSR